MNNKKISTVLLCALLSGYVLGQYPNDFQAVYPFNKGSNPTKNCSFTKDLKTPSYMLMANSIVSPTNVALAALKLDTCFYVLLTRSFLPSTSVSSVALLTNDVVATSDGGYIVCGSVTYDKITSAFMAKFNADANPIWYKEYPDITSLNAVSEVTIGTSIVKYVTCGTYISANNYATGIILGTDPVGVPMWQNNSLSSGNTDRIEYNDIIRYQTSFFFVVGNAITQPLNNKDVIVTRIDADGNRQFSNLYGMKNNEKVHFDEEGYGLTFAPNNQIVVTGRTKCYDAESSAIQWDDVLLFAVDLMGSPFWSFRYDMPLNNVSGEYGRKIISLNNQLYVSGYYKGTVFDSIPSNDAFLFETSLNGIPTQVRVYGDKNDDQFLAQEVNFGNYGIISAGFSNSFYKSPDGALTYCPYVVETYKKMIQPCHNAIFNLPYHNNDIAISNIDSHMTQAKYIDQSLKVIDNPVGLIIVCPKPCKTLTDTISTLKSETTEALTSATTKQVNPSNKITRLYPNPVQNTLFLEGANINSSYKIYNNNGKLVKQGKLNSSEINIANLSKGLYFISIVNEKEQVKLKFVKE